MEKLCKLENLSLRLGVKEFGPFSLEITKGEGIAILGPSGAGKTTLLKLLSHDLKAHLGVYQFKGKKIQDWSLSELSRSRAVLPQSGDVSFGLLAKLVIGLGRISIADDSHLVEIIEQAARLSCCEHLLDRGFNTLSGGEKARVHLARIFAQLWGEREGLILVDEPLASLDPGLQIELLHSIRQYALNRNHAIIAILHDINQAMQNFDRLILVREGKIIGDMPSGVQAVPSLEGLYNVHLHMVNIDGFGPLVIPKARSHAMLSSDGSQ